MTLGIMQPYFLPYIGYWQLINLVDSFVVYDKIQYTKKGWINRNRFLVEGQPKTFTLPLDKSSSISEISSRTISSSFKKQKLLDQWTMAYKKAPYFNETIPVIETILQYGEYNLFPYLFHSIQVMASYLEIKTQLIVSSRIPIEENLKGQEKVLALCSACNASIYINPIGGIELYSKEIFQKEKIDLRFLKSHQIEYQQYGSEHVPALSILDVLMFCGREKTIGLLCEYDLI